MKRIRSVQRSQLYNYYSQSYIWLEFFFFNLFPPQNREELCYCNFPYFITYIWGRNSTHSAVAWLSLSLQWTEPFLAAETGEAAAASESDFDGHKAGRPNR